MALVIIRKRERIETVTHQLFFAHKVKPGFGYGIVCDAQGNPVSDAFGSKEARKARIAELRKDADCHDPVVISHTNTYMAPAEGRCTCGATVYLSDGLENYCNCGICYNINGQVVHPELWEGPLTVDDY